VSRIYPAGQTATRIDLVTVSAAGADADTVRDLFLEYGESMGFNTCFAGLDQELPARDGRDASGCIGVRPLDMATCELKRLFVRPRFRRTGLGRKLAETAIAWARKAGYRRIVLDTLPAMREARALYAVLGFKRCTPYYDNRLLGSDCFDLDLLPDMTTEQPRRGEGLAPS